MIQQLFGSKTRVKLLHLFMNNPNRAFYVREMTRKIDEQINSVRRELSNLLSIGVITSESSNKRLYYEVNQNYEHYAALKSIFSDAKGKTPTVVTESRKDDSLLSKITSLGSVEVAVLSGTFTRDTSAPADIMIVGDINKTKLTNFIKEVEETEGREMRYVHMPQHEYLYRLDVNDRFLSDMMSSKKTVVIDKTGDVKE